MPTASLDAKHPRSQLSRRRDSLICEDVHQPATLGTAEAVTPFVVNVVPGAPVALTGTCTGHLHPAAMGDTSSPEQQSKG